MYIPEAFSQSDPDTLFTFIEQNAFGQLISLVDGRPFASHLPFLLHRESKTAASLLGHMALANPQWRQAEGQSILAIFSGPHTYISPTWYESENAVPTWNYVAVHVYGTLRVIHDAETLTEMLRTLVDEYEGGRPRPWPFEADSGFARKMMKAIVGFRIEMTHIEGKWKLNQNRPNEQRERVVKALQHAADVNSLAIADLMDKDLRAPR